MKNNLLLNQLGDFFDTFLPNIRLASKRTISSYADSFAIFFQFLHEAKGIHHNLVTYKQLNIVLFEEFMLWMKNVRNYSPSSIRQRITAISSFLKYASHREMMAVSAYTGVVAANRPHITHTEFPYFTLEEMKILLSLPNNNVYLGERDLVLLSLLYETGARAQEICDLCVGDIRFGKPFKVKLHGKGSKVREVPVSDGVSKLLQYHLKQHNISINENRNNPLFLSQTNDKMTTACVRSIVSKYVNIAKKENPTLFAEPKYSPHSFRHSKAVHMVEAGVNLIYIRNFLGHATITSTEIYARVGQAAITKALTERKIPMLATAVPKQNQNKCTLPDFINNVR